MSRRPPQEAGGDRKGPVRRIAVYGKGGIGKSTIAANLSAALAERGLKVLQIGCDPKRDSTRLLLGGRRQATALDLLKDRRPEAIRVEEVAHVGYRDVHCVEAGGPEPGVGCAGRGILSMANLLEAVGLQVNAYDVVLYDVLGDVVCGGFAVPMRDEYVDEVYIVTSGELMALYAANNIARGLRNFSAARGKLAGVIGNSRGLEGEREQIEALARRLGTSLATFVPRDPVFRQTELARQTVIEFAPGSPVADLFRDLAARILVAPPAVQPTPLTEKAFESFVLGREPEPASKPAARESREPAVPDAPLIFRRYAPEAPEMARREKMLSRAVREETPLYSCALQGAFGITAHVEGALTIMHSPAGCAHASLSGTWLAGAGTALRGRPAASGHLLPPLLCTEMLEEDAVRGAVGRLAEAIRNARTRHDPSAIFIITSCPSAIIGDDPNRAAREAGVKDIPLVVVASEGIMEGDYAQGLVNGYRALAGLADPAITPEPGWVNIVGESPVANVAEETFAGLADILAGLNLKVNCRFVRRTSLGELRRLRRAPLCVQVESDEPARAARAILEAEIGARFLDDGFPVGFEATRMWIETLANATGTEDRAPDLVRRARAQYEALAAPLRRRLGGTRAAVIGYAQDVSWIREVAGEVGMTLERIVLLPSAVNAPADARGIDTAPTLEDALRLMDPGRVDLLLCNYSPGARLSPMPVAPLPLTPVRGIFGGLAAAGRWVRALQPPTEGWRLDAMRYA